MFGKHLKKKKDLGLVVNSKLNKGLQCNTALGKQTHDFGQLIQRDHIQSEWDCIRGDKAFENTL